MGIILGYVYLETSNLTFSFFAIEYRRRSRKGVNDRRRNGDRQGK